LTVPGETQTQVHGSNDDGDAESTAASIDSGGKVRPRVYFQFCFRFADWKCVRTCLVDLQPSLKQKIKGEVKVLAGKVSKDSKKVEAGKALKEGHAAAA
jgi:hypothetical protein